MWRRRRRTKTPAPTAPVPEEKIARPAVTPLPDPLPRLTGIRGRVLEAYRSGLLAVEKITGRIMAPQATLREFLKTAPLPSPAAFERFAELTAIAENTLYAPGNPRQDTAARAEELAGTIREDLDHGTP